MDAFKLLSRSTNLQKHLSGARTSVNQHVPSAGVPAHPQTLNDEETKRGVKRKRGGTTIQPKDNQDSSDNPESTNGAGSGMTFSREEHGLGARQVAGGDIEPFELRSEEECKKILKMHKLKITLMKSMGTVSMEEQKQRSSTGKKSSLTQLAVQPLETFKDLRPRYKISRRLAENLDSQGYTTPTEVQLGSIPILLGSDQERGFPIKSSSKRRAKRSDVDLLTIAPTGSGKTLAFLIPVIQSILNERFHSGQQGAESRDKEFVKAVVLAPTRELADQIVNEGRKLTAGTGLKVAIMRKGMHVFQGKCLEKANEEGQNTFIKADVLVSTPLLLLHALEADDIGDLKLLPSIKSLVLDEADVLLDPLFREQTLGIWHACTNADLRVTFWSATIGSSIESLIQAVIVERRERLALPSKNHHIVRLIAGLKDSALPTVSHRLVYAATERGKLFAVRQILHPSSAGTPTTEATPLRPPFLIFTQTIPRAIALHSELLYDVPPEAGGSSRIEVLHSDLSDTARSSIMAKFRKGEVWVLITTDLLSRGIDFRGVNGIVNYDIPNTSASYVHRAGRTGRAGREGGIAVTLYTKEDIPYVKNVANVIAASEKVHGKAGDGSGGVQKWLLDALPDVNKKTKRDLKWGGVAARRGLRGADEKGAKEARRMRISTKSGFDRRRENRRKGVAEANQRRAVEKGQEKGAHEDEWSGFMD